MNLPASLILTSTVWSGNLGLPPLINNRIGCSSCFFFLRLHGKPFNWPSEGRKGLFESAPRFDLAELHRLLYDESGLGLSPAADLVSIAKPCVKPYMSQEQSISHFVVIV